MTSSPPSPPPSSLSSLSSSFCPVCRIDVQSWKALREHVKGRKHQRKLLGLPHPPDVDTSEEYNELVWTKNESESLVLDEQTFFQQLAVGSFKNIIVCTGAGVSTAAGIPDFRSQGGLFEEVRKRFQARFPELIDSPEVAFSRSFALREPELWNKEIRPMLLEWDSAVPTRTHRFCSWLHQQGWLRRVYTQNIDGLHTHNGCLPEEKVVECHGSLKKSNIVMYGDALPDLVDSCLKEDFGEEKTADVDLVLVFGTSLQVAPFCAIPNLALRNCTRVLVCYPLSDCLENPWTKQKQWKDFESGPMDFYSTSVKQSSSVRLAGREVTLRPLWTAKPHKMKYRKQLLIDCKCDLWVSRLFSYLEALKKQK